MYMYIPIGLEVDTADSQVVAATCEPGHVTQCLPVRMYGLWTVKGAMSLHVYTCTLLTTLVSLKLNAS